METIIRRRFPNSISALIYAASHIEGEGGEQKGGKEPTPSVLYFEKKVHKLEHELEERDAEHSRRVRALQQQYTAMEVGAVCACRYTGHRHTVACTHTRRPPSCVCSCRSFTACPVLKVGLLHCKPFLLYVQGTCVHTYCVYSHTVVSIP